MSDTKIKEVIKLEYRKCFQDPVYFMRKYCVIQHPQRGKVNFNLYPYQEDTLRTISVHDYSIILKSRQLGISTLCAAYALWYMMFFSDKNIMVLATKQEVAKNLVTKVRVMYENLPSWLRVTAIEDNKLSLRLKNGSQIKASTTQADSGRSEALSMLIVDECFGGDTTVSVKDIGTNETSTVSMSQLFNL
jgi:phage terminase large subunit-like protein